MDLMGALSACPAAVLVVLASRAAPRNARQAGAAHPERPKAYRDQDDGVLIEWSAQGDRQAFDEIVRRYGPFALRVASRLLSSTAAAEDVAQEAMVRAWAQAGSFDPHRARFSTWLYRIIVNLCIDHRRRKVPDALPDDFDVPDPSQSADERMEENEKRAALREALQELPARQRAAVTLIYDEGLSGNEAARVLSLSAKAVERLLARARASLRARLTGQQ